LKTAIEYELAKRMRSATRWVEGQQGMLPPEEQFVPPIGYGGNVTALVEAGSPADANIAAGKIVLSGVANGADVWVTTVSMTIPTKGKRDFAQQNGTFTIAGITKTLYVFQASASVDFGPGTWVRPFGAKYIHPINKTTGLVDYGSSVTEMLWYDDWQSPRSLYILQLTFQKRNQSDPFSFYARFSSMNATRYDGSIDGKAASWAGRLPKLLWNMITGGQGLSAVRFANSHVLSKTYLDASFYPPGYSADTVDSWVLPEVIDGKSVLTPIKYVPYMAIDFNTHGLYLRTVTACTYDGSVYSGSAIPEVCMIDQQGLRVIFKTNGFIHRQDRAFLGVIDDQFQVVNVIPNKPPNAPIVTAPMATPL